MGVDILALLSGAIVSGLVDLLAGFVLDLIGGSLEQVFQGQFNVAEILDNAWTGILARVSNFASDALQTMHSLSATAVNTGAAALKGVLGVVDAQTELIESLQYGAEHYLDDLLVEQKAAAAREMQTGAALTDFAFRLIAEHSEKLSMAGEVFFGSLEAGVSEERFGTTNYAAAMLGQVQEWLVADLMMVENLSTTQATAAAQMVIEIAKEDARFVEEWFLETVAKPIAYGSNFEWALRSVAQMDPEVFKEQLLGSIRASWEVYEEILAKGYTPPG